MKMKIGRISGDGIGPEIVREASKVLEKVCEKYGHEIAWTEIPMGGCSIDLYGEPLTEQAIADAKASDAVLMGSIGGNTVTYANLRPAYLFPELADSCPLAKRGDKARNFDLIIVRELTGGLYFGVRHTETENGVRKATDTLTYDENEIRRVMKTAFDIAGKRGGRVCSVDKANVLDTSRLWRKIAEEVHAEYPDVELTHMLVDNCAMQLVLNPEQFDVVVTENMFGDILSDEAAMITGSIGMLSSASLNETGFGLYEPSHGSAPDIAGKDIANPIATILSASMMLRYTFGLQEEADAIHGAVKQALADGYRTADIMPLEGKEGFTLLGCQGMGNIVTSYI